MPKKAENPFASLDFNQYNNYQSIIYILTVPFSAISTWVAYTIAGDKRYNFTEHIVINLYYSAQVIIITALLSILFLCFGFNYLTISGIVSILSLAYFFYVLKRVFSNTFWETLLRYILVMLSYLFIFFIVIVITVVIVFIILKT